MKRQGRLDDTEFDFIDGLLARGCTYERAVDPYDKVSPKVKSPVGYAIPKTNTGVSHLWLQFLQGGPFKYYESPFITKGTKTSGQS
jgi:hypothetical protein